MDLASALSSWFSPLADDDEGKIVIDYLDRIFAFALDDGTKAYVNFKDSRITTENGDPPVTDLVRDLTIIETSPQMLDQLLHGAILPTEFLFSGEVYVSSMGAAMTDNNAFLRACRRAQELRPSGAGSPPRQSRRKGQASKSNGG
jgi:hypothetical protein